MLRPPRLFDVNNVYNWTMTYRADSDFPVPYGRLINVLPHPSEETEDLRRLVRTFGEANRHLAGDMREFKVCFLFVEFRDKYVSVYFVSFSRFFVSLAQKNIVYCVGTSIPESR